MPLEKRWETMRLVIRFRLSSPKHSSMDSIPAWLARYSYSLTFSSLKEESGMPRRVQSRRTSAKIP